MNFLSLLGPFAPILLGIVIALSISNGIFVSLYSGAKDDLATVQATLSSERNQAKADAEQAKERADRTTADVSLAWDAAYRHLKSSRPIRVLRTPSDLPDANAAPTGTVDGPGIKPQPDTARSVTCDECEAIANNAVADALTLEFLQYWIRSQQ